MITSSIKSVVLALAVFGTILNWWTGWVILLVMAGMIQIKKHGKTI